VAELIGGVGVSILFTVLFGCFAEGVWILFTIAFNFTDRHFINALTWNGFVMLARVSLVRN
jgi:hypothetical protein